MLQVAIYDTGNLNIFAHSLYTGYQTTDATHNHINFYSCSRGLVKFVDQNLFFEVVHFYGYRRRLALFGMCYFAIDQAEKNGLQVKLRYQQVFKMNQIGS
ncbi:hypothetical protein D3C72_2068990 [compost metagenome]